jgi:succinate dehydrogenase/fumarate reductase flavoprotein subunit
MGLDLATEPLEVGVCAQHCNGGFVVNTWWETNVPHLFAVGELAGTHGVKRPGGSALNSGQVGGLRAAQRIAHVYYGPGPAAEEAFEAAASKAVEGALALINGIKRPGSGALKAEQVKAEIQRRMSTHAGMVRSLDGLARALSEAEAQWRALRADGISQEGPGYVDAVEVRELALAQLAFLRAMKTLLERGGGSRGSHLVADPSGILPHPDLGDAWRFLPENLALRDEILCVSYAAASDAFATRVTAPRPFPQGEFWFENTWAEYRDAAIFRERPDDKPRGQST